MLDNRFSVFAKAVLLVYRRGRRNVRAWRSLGTGDRRLLWTAWLTLLWFRLLLWFLPAASVTALLRAKRPGRVRSVYPCEGSPGAYPHRAARAVQLASRAVPAATCLARALALRLMLRRAGIDSVLQIGVSREPGGPLRAHAWIEVGGEVLPDAAFASDYTLLRGTDEGGS